MEILNKLEMGIIPNQVVKEIRKSKDFSYLPEIDYDAEPFGEVPSDFSSNKKSEIYIAEALYKSPRCSICGGHLHKNAISIDHIERKQDGGKATIDNGQLTHPYCNSGYKN